MLACQAHILDVKHGGTQQHGGTWCTSVAADTAAEQKLVEHLPSDGVSRGLLAAVGTAVCVLMAEGV